MNSSNITQWQIGDKIKISRSNYTNIHNANRSIKAFPRDSYLAIAHDLMINNIPGTVSQLFIPGYEVNVTFDNGQILQMKDNWITVKLENEPYWNK